MLDIGDVLADKGPVKRFYFDAFAPGAFPFLCLAVAKVGADNIYICSRTNQGNSKRETCWGYRWLSNIGLFEVLGVPQSNVQFCTGYSGRSGKGPWAWEWDITHMVDDMPVHLDSYSRYRGDSLAADGLILFGDGPQAGVSRNMVRVRDFRALVDHLGIGVPHFQAARELLDPLVTGSQHPSDLKNFLTLFDVLRKRLQENTLKVATRPDVASLSGASNNIVKDAAGERVGGASESGASTRDKRRPASSEAFPGRAEKEAKPKICEDVHPSRRAEPSPIAADTKRLGAKETGSAAAGKRAQDKPPETWIGSCPGQWMGNVRTTPPHSPRPVAGTPPAAATPERWPLGGPGYASASSWAPQLMPARMPAEPLHGWAGNAWAAPSVPVWPLSPWGQVPPPTHACAAAVVPPDPSSRAADSSSSTARQSSSYCGHNWSPKPDDWYSRSRKECDAVQEHGGRNSEQGKHTGANYDRKQKKQRKDAGKKAADPSYETRSERRARERAEELNAVIEAPTVLKPKYQ